MNGSPLLFVYRLNRHQYETAFLKEAVAYISALNNLAVADGFPGLHIPFPALFGEHELYTQPPMKFPDTMPKPADDAVVFYAYPTLLPNRQVEIPRHCFKGSYIDGNDLPQYLGLTTTFDHSLRRTWGRAFIWQREFSRYNATVSFELDTLRALMYERCCQNPSVRRKGGQFIMVNAWNEWGEGMALEPSDVYGYEFLRAIRRAKEAASLIQCDWSRLDEFEESFPKTHMVNRKGIAKYLRRHVDELQKTAKGSKRITAEMAAKIKDLAIFTENVLLPLIGE